MKEVFHFTARTRILDTPKTTVVLTVAIVVRFPLETISLSQANIIIVYVLGALVVAAVTASRWYNIDASLASVLLFNYISTEPMFVLKAGDVGTQLTFLITFLVTVFTSSYTVQMKEEARLSQQDVCRSGVTLDISQMLQKAAAPVNILSCAARRLNKLLKRDTTRFEQDGAGLKSPLRFREHSSLATGRGLPPDILEEPTVARECLREGKETGAATEVSPAAAYHFLPLQSSGAVYGVMGILVGNTLPGDPENSPAAAIIAQCFTMLEKEYIPRKREEEAAMARAEQLRSNLLRSISHDLHTLLTSISSNAGVLMSDGGSLTVEHRNRIYKDIYDDSMWLTNLVENLLPITCTEGQGAHLHMEIELLEGVIDEAIRYINRRHEHHTIKVNQAGDYTLTDMDTRLIIQIITNLVDNAVEYTSEGPTIMVNSCQEGSSAVTDVSDSGPGIPDESKEKTFEIFYTTGHKPAGGKRGMGLGLPLCRATLSAHRGAIEVLDNKPAGSIFRLTLSAKEVSLHE